MDQSYLLAQGTVTVPPCVKASGHRFVVNSCGESFIFAQNQYILEGQMVVNFIFKGKCERWMKTVEQLEET